MRATHIWMLVAVVALSVAVVLFVRSGKTPDQSHAIETTPAVPPAVATTPIPMPAPIVPPAPAKPPDPHIVFHWSFDASMVDERHPAVTPDVHNAQLTSGTVGGRSYRGSTFNGADSLISSPDHPDFGKLRTFTLAAWVYPTAHKTQEVLLKGAALREQSAPFGLAFSQTKDAIFSVHLAGASYAVQARTPGYQINRWTHIAGVFDGARAQLFLDGELRAEEPCPGTLYVNDEPLLIGSRLGLPSDTFQGHIDEISIYDRPLSKQEVATAFAVGK